MSDPVAEIRRELSAIGLHHEPGGRRHVLVRIPTRMRGDFGVVVEVAERSAALRAFLLRAPDRNAEDVYRRALKRNLAASTWSFAVDDDGDLFLVARVMLGGGPGLDEVLGELALLVDESYEGLVRLGFDVPADVAVGAPPQEGA